MSVALEEWLPYEQLVAEWLFVNGEFHLGYDRFRKIIQVLETMPKEFQEYEELIELIDDYLEPEEYDAATHEMLQLLYKKVQAISITKCHPYGIRNYPFCNGSYFRKIFLL
jgi:two-component SAPR family response regulator